MPRSVSHNPLFRAAALLLAGFILVAPAASAQVMTPLQVVTQATDTVKAGKFDNGKMWTFEYPPTEYLRQTYNFTPDTTWYRKARLGALRIPGCSASLVSARGLVMTNHHCGRDGATEVRKSNENILDNGFFARSDGDERKAESMYADQLIAIADVSREVDSAAAAQSDPAAANAAREKAGEAITARLTKQHGEKDTEVEIISLWNGAKTSAYVFKRYKDVRLVMTPELQIGYFGGDSDNFTYPRYALDFTFFRLYGADGKPLATPDHFTWSTEGVKDGDLIFVIGNPGSTSRLQTVAELEFRRDVQSATLVRLLNDRVDAYQAYVKAHPDAPDELRNELFGFLNAEKAYTGMLTGLRDPYIIARRRADERAFQETIRAKPELQQKYGTLHDRMARVQEQKRSLEREVKSFTALGHPTLDAAILRRAISAGQYLSGKTAGAPTQVLDAMKAALLAIGNQPRDLQESLLAGRLRDIAWGYGASSTDARAIFDGRSPEVLAAEMLRSPLADSASTAKAIDAGTLVAEDPAIRVAGELIKRMRPYQQRMAQLSGEEENISREIGSARFAVHGVAIPPDATFSLRLADGLVKGYEYNGTVAPVYTTMHGLYDRYFSFGGAAGGEWALPKRWVDKASAVKLSTPANFISTADIIGGNSGSPVVDKQLRVVGLIFDGNIESLPGDYIYLDQRSRAVAVDARGILEALKSVYGADRLVKELTGGK